MLCFDVSLNGRPLCRAGVGPRGVISAIVSWVRRRATPEESRRLSGKRLTEELFLEVGGMLSSARGGQEDLRWATRPLQPGDEVTIRVVRASRPDPPQRRKVESRATLEKQRREYYERLKAHYGDA